MNAEIIRGYLPVLEKERILNVSYQAGYRYGVLAMLAKRDDTVFLWEICNETEEEYAKKVRFYKQKPRTNRALLRDNLHSGDSLPIKEIEINGQKLSVSSASGTCIGEDYNEAEQIMLIYMIERGLRLGRLEHEPLSRLRMNCYEMKEKNFPQIEEGSSPSLMLEVAEQQIPVLVNKRFHLKLRAGKESHIVKVKKEEEFIVYINGIRYFDAWADAETRFQDKQYTEGFSEEEIARVKKEFMKNLPELCPKGYVIPLIEYECENDYQVQFYSTEYLRRAPKGSSSAMFLLFRPDKEKGPRGCRNRVCPLEAVEKGFEGSIDMELFLYYKKIPGEKLEGQRTE